MSAIIVKEPTFGHCCPMYASVQAPREHRMDFVPEGPFSSADQTCLRTIAFWLGAVVYSSRFHVRPAVERCLSRGAGR